MDIAVNLWNRYMLPTLCMVITAVIYITDLSVVDVIAISVQLFIPSLIQSEIKSVPYITILSLHILTTYI